MTSWAAHNSPQIKIRLGWYHELPQGTFTKKENTPPPTVVSAFYPTKTKKWNRSQYNEWIRNFLESVPCHLIFFTDKETSPFIEECRKNHEDRTAIILCEREEWVANKNFPPNFWENQWKIDTEQNIHCPDLYKIWYEKKEFVKIAIQLNPFQSQDFVWCDAGVMRYPEMRNMFKNFPVASRIPTDRILINNIWPFSKNDELPLIKTSLAEIPRAGSGKPRIGASIIAASARLWEEYDKIYESVLKRFLQAGLFIGKEQTIMAVMAIENKNKFSLLDAKPICNNGWFYPLWWLGANDRLFQLLTTKKEYERKRDLADLAKL